MRVEFRFLRNRPEGDRKRICSSGIGLACLLQVPFHLQSLTTVPPCCFLKMRTWNPYRLSPPGPHLGISAYQWQLAHTGQKSQWLSSTNKRDGSSKNRNSYPPPKPMPAPTQSLKNGKSRARPFHQGCCSGLCLLCYLEAWHSTTCPSC